jgi:hypothetical protein
MIAPRAAEVVNACHHPRRPLASVLDTCWPVGVAIRRIWPQVHYALGNTITLPVAEPFSTVL